MLPVALLLGAASAARVGLAIAHHEVFGAEATLAFGCALSLPVFIAKRLRGLWQEVLAARKAGGAVGPAAPAPTPIDFTARGPGLRARQAAQLSNVSPCA